jgi:uncharacterized membrane protein YheB (UPF0754 family)
MIELLQLLLIPIMAALVGWSTNVLAIKMTFGPKEFVGIGPFGWQGIIPAKGPRMAARATELLTENAIKIEEQFEKLDGDAVAKNMDPVLRQLSKELVDETISEELGAIWRFMPKAARNRIYEEVQREFPKVIRSILEDIRKDIHDLLDLKSMMIEAMTRDRGMMARIFKKCGHSEFKFIERSGLYFGFLFGLIQMAIWNYFNHWWLLPLGGVLVGYATNWLALKLIFRPLQPIQVGPIKLQGLFLKRQKEVSAEYSKIIALEVVTFEKMFSHVLHHKGGNELTDLVQRRVKESVDRSAGILGRTYLQFSRGSEGYDRMRQRAANHFMEKLPISVRSMFDYADEAMDIEDTLKKNLSEMDPEAFEGVLRPAFQEDEMMLILVGAGLGLFAGTAQVFLISAF